MVVQIFFMTDTSGCKAVQVQSIRVPAVVNPLTGVGAIWRQGSIAKPILYNNY